MTSPKTSDERTAAAQSGLVVRDASGMIEAWMYSPQVGGYSAVMCVRTAREDGCFDVTVWHDGEFPHGGESDDPPQKPVELHGCTAWQWLRWAGRLAALQGLDVEDCIAEMREGMAEACPHDAVFTDGRGTCATCGRQIAAGEP